MSYQLHITSAAEHDLIRAVDYIEFTLKNPDAADKLLDNATEQILHMLYQNYDICQLILTKSQGSRYENIIDDENKKSQAIFTNLPVILKKSLIFTFLFLNIYRVTLLNMQTKL